MSADRILLVDDEEGERRALRNRLVTSGYEVREACDGEEALPILAEFAPAVVLTDVRMPRMDGVALMRKSKESGSDASFLMMTGYATVELAVEAMRTGAENFLMKPVDIDALLLSVKETVAKRHADRGAAPRDRARSGSQRSDLVGDSPEMQAVFELVKNVGPTKATVLVVGEPGTGKDLVGQALHKESPRRDEPFVKISCSSVSQALFESELFGDERKSGALCRREGRLDLAQRGTLFLDDVADVPLGTQPKLLRLLQWREFERVGGTETLEADVRIIAATNRDLAAEVRAGRFCEELYYRLNVFTVELPPLRRRKGDIPALVAHFIEKHAATNGKVLHGLGPATLKAILAYEWPGNVRELENAIASAVAVCRYGELRFCDLPAALRGGGRNAAGGDLQPASAPADPATARLQDVERDAILRAVALVGGSTARAAEMLGISVRKVQYRMKAYRDSRRGSSKGGGGEPSSDG